MRYLTLFLIVALATVSCRKDESKEGGGGPNSPTGYYIQLKVDGVDWTADAVTTALDVGPTLNITGGSLNMSSINIFLEQPVSVGTYIADDQSMNIMTFNEGFAPEKSFSTFNSGGNGTVNITKAGPTEYEGTFQFVGVNNNGDTRTITDGRFKVKLN